MIDRDIVARQSYQDVRWPMRMRGSTEENAGGPGAFLATKFLIRCKFFSADSSVASSLFSCVSLGACDH